MRLHLVLWILGAALAAPGVAWADPPDHAPAHGHRNKHGHAGNGGFALVFDAQRGVQVAVDFPDVYFEAGKYYRYADGGWHVSVRADGGWSLVASGHVPVKIEKAHHHTPGPAKADHPKRKKN